MRCKLGKERWWEGKSVTRVGSHADEEIGLPEWRPIFSDTVQSRPGWRRQGVELAVADLTKTIQGLNAQGAILEHLYDY